MATKYTLTTAFTAITETSGTIQNVGNEVVELVSTTNETEGEGILLAPHEKRTFNGALSARSLGDAGAEVNVVDFTEAGEGGEEYVLPIASDTELGGIKISNSFTVASDGTLSIKKSGKTILGAVKSSDDEGKVTVNNDGTMTYNPLGYRQPSTAYTVGNIAYHNALSMQKLVCVKAGTTASGNVTPNTTEGALVTDGTVTWQVDSLADGNYTAIHQNDIGGGRDITAYWESGIMSTNIQAGIFVGMHIGDYIIKSVTIDGTTYSNVKHILMDFDYHLHCGDTETTAHHVVIMTEEVLGSAQMNDTNTTEGGYLGSKMWTEHMPKVTAGFEAAFGAAHILTHKELLSNAMDANLKSNAYDGWSGATSNWTWASVKANLANEDMVYGAPVQSSSVYDTGECKNQLAAFRLNHGLISPKRYGWWLRSVTFAGRFAFVDGTGYAGSYGAVNSTGVRPIALLH